MKQILTYRIGVIVCVFQPEIERVWKQLGDQDNDDAPARVEFFVRAVDGSSRIFGIDFTPDDFDAGRDSKLDFFIRKGKRDGQILGCRMRADGGNWVELTMAPGVEWNT